MRIAQRIDYPQIGIEVDRVKAHQLGVTQEAVIKNVVTAAEFEYRIQPGVLDRTELQSLFHRRTISRGGHRLAGDVAGHSDHWF